MGFWCLKVWLGILLAMVCGLSLKELDYGYADLNLPDWEDGCNFGEVFVLSCYRNAIREFSCAVVCSPFTAGRYHSLVIEKDTFPNEALEITAWTEDGLIMAARHKKYKHLQFYT
ncbi:Anthranilate synthase beta subunit 2, chloroplastic [Vitis vinifera]|uniref:Anthranilate synthase beta subunit 2, chloroplastic n=1 Tax=Vitis vinifera TaxID=29760 RepID=A0A438DGK1_VITVI|nr:Anthranilate synthase beta subunit 2, chloroplastic [Vitis vinifera]